jgi:hypothetical protein
MHPSEPPDYPQFEVQWCRQRHLVLLQYLKLLKRRPCGIITSTERYVVLSTHQKNYNACTYPRTLMIYRSRLEILSRLWRKPTLTGGLDESTANKHSSRPTMSRNFLRMLHLQKRATQADQFTNLSERHMVVLRHQHRSLLPLLLPRPPLADPVAYNPSTIARQKENTGD